MDHEEIWHVQVAAGDVRVVTLDQLNDLYRFDVVDENMFVWQPGMNGWVTLGTLLDIEEPEETYHVQVAPGTVKEVTLEQLDDYYRYGVIEEGTYVWQKGMSEWKTLGALAGIDEESNATALAPQPAQQQAQRAPATQYTQRIQQSQPTPYVQSALGVQTVAQQASATRPQHDIPTRPLASPKRQATPDPISVSVPSAPPVAYGIEPAVEQRGSGMRWATHLTMAAGILLALVRNDVLYSAVEKTPLGERYRAIESSTFGGPVFGTTRFVEQLVADCGGHLEPVRLPIQVEQFTHAKKKEAAAQAEAAQASAAKAADKPAAEPRSAASPANAPTAPAVANAANANPTARASNQLGQNVAAALGGMPVKSVKAAKAPAPAHATKKRASNQKGVMRSSGSYYDPLNPSL